MLNPEKSDQAELRDTLQQVLAFMLKAFQQTQTAAFDDVEYARLKNAAFDAMTRLGEETWRQVKSLS